MKFQIKNSQFKMPVQRSVPFGKSNSFRRRDEPLSEDMLLLLLRKKEIIAYHRICEAFRAQGHLTPEKLKLLKEIGAALSIPECRHKAAIVLAVNDSELNRIAECVAGPNTEAEWRKEGMEEGPLEPERIVYSAYLPIADAVAKAIVEAQQSAPDDATVINKTIRLRTVRCSETVVREDKKSKRTSEQIKIDVKEETPSVKNEDEIKEEDKDGELSSTVSTTSETQDEPMSPSETKNEEKVTEEERGLRPDTDAILMPPPPVSTVATPLLNGSTIFPGVIAPPTPTSFVSFPSTSNIITVPPSTSTSSESPTSTPSVITDPPCTSTSSESNTSTPSVITDSPSTSTSSESPASTPSAITDPPSTSTKVNESHASTPSVITVPPSTSTSSESPASNPNVITGPPPPPTSTVSLSSTPNIISVSPTPTSIARIPSPTAVTVPSPIPTSIVSIPSSTIITVPSPTPTSIVNLPTTSTVNTVLPSTPNSVVSILTNPTVITVPPSSSIPTLPTSPSFITVPPSSSILTVSPPHPAVITVPPPTNLSDVSASCEPLTMSISSPTLNPSSSALFTTPPMSSTCEINECTPVLSEDMQFVSFSEPIDSSLPSLVVVPPPEPVITVPHSSSFSSTQSTPTLVIPSGMSIQLGEENQDVKKRKRTLSQDGDGSMSYGPCSKSLAFSQVPKMTPVMMTVASMSAAGLKVTPTISRAKMTVSTQPSITTSTQKVFIVSNTSSGSAPVIQRSLNVPMGVPFLQGNQPRLQPVVPVSAGMTKVRPRMLAVPGKYRPKSSPVVIPVSGHNLQLKNTFTIKQDNLAVVDTSGKKITLGSGAPTKILPKPQSSMFIVNTSQGPQKIAPMTLQAGGQSTRMLAPRIIEGPGPKQNVVILQKGGGKTQRVTLSNSSKDLVQKLMSKKCVVIQSTKARPKTVPPKSVPPSAPVSVPTSSASNVVVLDLSQEQYRQNLSSKTLAEILQASGLLSAASTVTTSSHTTSVATPEHSDNWLSLEATKNLALEEVTLPIGQSESVVTLDEAVELLGESMDQPAAPSVVPMETLSDPSGQMFTITQEELSGSNVTFMSETVSPVDSNCNQPVEVHHVGETVREAYPSQREGAVTIQHSNIDMPANMSLEDYSSQQLENQGLN